MAKRFDFSEIVVEYTQLYNGFYSSVPVGDGAVVRTRKGDDRYESHEAFSWEALRTALVTDGFAMTRRLRVTNGTIGPRTVREFWSRSLMGTIVIPVEQQGVRVYGA